MECILVGVDGSWGSREAVRYAADLAKSTGSRLILAMAVYFHKALGAPELEAQVAAWEEEENERSAKVLGKMAGVLRRRGAAVETLVLSGPPAEAPCEEARAAEVDLVVVGHRGRGGLRRVLPGRVAVRLVEVCPKPVISSARVFRDLSTMAPPRLGGWLTPPGTPCFRPPSEAMIRW